MSVDIISLVTQIQDDFNNQKVEIENLKKGLDMRMAKIKKRETEATEREKQLSEYERKLDKKYEEVSRMENAKYLEMKAQQDNNDSTQKLAAARKLREEAEQDLAEAKIHKQEVAAREAALTIREKEYQDKIEKQVVKRFMSGTLT